ncbi:MAG: phytanoyl-CoA dioxygenase family protein [Bacteroidia bacterium]|nr:phytanoyl-CoA dioxygenase family protein [Bacteroidia bacterium]
MPHQPPPFIGQLNLPVLYALWQKTTDNSPHPSNPNRWADEMHLINSLNIGLDEILQYLFFERPSYPELEAWVVQKNNGHIPEEKLDRIRNRVMETGDTVEDVLTAADLDFWHTNGYVVLKQAITPAQTLATARAIWEFLQADPLRPETWYQSHRDQRGLMYLFYHHPALEANRQCARIRRAYEQIYQSRELFVSTDKISFNPPETENFRFRGSALHWDTSLIAPVPMDLQGLLYLTDVGTTDGAFQCVPGFHKKIDAWLAGLPSDANPREIAVNTFNPRAVPGQAGDFIIWHQALPHCASPNRGKFPRLVQYISWHMNNRHIHSEWR